MSEQEPKKIALVGTSRVGKTTILKHFRQKYSFDPNFAFVGEAARAFFAANPHVLDRFSAGSQARVQSLVLQNEQEAHASGATIIFCDRSVIDAVAYVKATGDFEGAEKLYDRVVGWLPTYHAFLLLDPADIPYETDEVRQETEEERQRFHQGFLDFFAEKGISFELLSGTIEQRIERVEEIISS